MADQPVWSTLTSSSKNRIYSWLPVLVFGLLVALFNGPYLRLFPQGMHEWAQADRLALAYGFYDHGFDFLHPRTFSLASVDGIVGVEFPLQSYLAALLGLIIGRSNLSLGFRLLDMVMMTAACVYLFKLVFEATRNAGLGLVPGAFLLSSPVFVFYAGNYLPDPFSVSLLCIAFYYLHRYFYQGRQYHDVVVGLSVATLATMVKSSVIIYLGAICFVLLVMSYLHHTLFRSIKQKLGFLAMLMLSLAAIGGWIYYMRWLNTNYAAWIFLADIRPLQDSAQNNWVQQEVLRRWAPDYLTASAYLLVRVSLLLMAVYAVVRWRKTWQSAPFFGVLGLSAVLLGAFYLLMGAQYAAHDYYIIASALPLALLVVLGALFALHLLAGNRLWLQLAGLLLAVVLLGNGYRHHHLRMEIRNGLDPFTYWLPGGAAWLSKAGVPAKARLLVVGIDAAPNLSLSHLERPGIVVADSASRLDANTALRTMASHQLQYVVMSGKYFRQLQTQNANFLGSFRAVGADPRRVVMTPRQPLPGW